MTTTRLDRSRTRVGPGAASDRVTWITSLRVWALPVAMAPVLVAVGATGASYGRWIGDSAIIAAALVSAVALAMGSSLVAVFWEARQKQTLVHPDLRRLAIGAGICWMVAFAVLLWLTLRSGSWYLLPGAAGIAIAWVVLYNRRIPGPRWWDVPIVIGGLSIGASAGCVNLFIGGIPGHVWAPVAAIGLLAAAIVVVDDMEYRKTIEPRCQQRFAGRVLVCALIAASFGLLVFLIATYPFAQYGFLALLATAPAVIIVVTAKTAAEFRIARWLTSLTLLAIAATVAQASLG